MLPWVRCESVRQASWIGRDTDSANDQHVSVLASERISDPLNKSQLLWELRLVRLLATGREHLFRRLYRKHKSVAVLRTFKLYADAAWKMAMWQLMERVRPLIEHRSSMDRTNHCIADMPSSVIRYMRVEDLSSDPWRCDKPMWHR